MYGKLFTQMFDGTLATNGPWEALVTFQQLIILANKNGEVDMTAGAIAKRTTIPLEIIQTGLAELLKPDPESRSPDEEGRRIVPLEDNRSWGWRLVNYAHYRLIRSEDERREYHRQYGIARRAKAKEGVNTSSTKDNTSTGVNAKPPKQYAVGSKQKTEGQKKELVRGSRLPLGWSPASELIAWAKKERPDLPVHREIDSFIDYWRSVAGPKGVKLDWDATFRNWIRRATGGLQRAAANSTPSKARQKINNLQEFRNGLAKGRNSDAVSTADMPLLGSPADRRSD